jgi:hypothetical protein|nr:MAG TPA: hypothetical protein [Caudoviricetes sp.]
MEIRQAFVDGKLLDVVTQEEYERRSNLKNEEMLKNTCIERDGTLYPVVKRPDVRKTPHVINMGPVFKYVGSADKFPAYSSNKVIDYSNVKSNRELIEQQSKARKEEMAILTQTGKVFAPVIREEDSPALKCVKECFHAKKIDIDNYRGRFDSNCDFANTVRLFVNPNNHTISVQKIQLVGEKFDIDFKLVASDKKGAVNPMDKTIDREL